MANVKLIPDGYPSLPPYLIVADQFYGNRLGTLQDPFGHVWHVSTHIEDVNPEEIDRRAAEAMKGQGA